MLSLISSWCDIFWEISTYFMLDVHFATVEMVSYVCISFLFLFCCLSYFEWSISQIVLGAGHISVTICALFLHMQLLAYSSTHISYVLTFVFQSIIFSLSAHLSYCYLNYTGEYLCALFVSFPFMLSRMVTVIHTFFERFLGWLLSGCLMISL